MIRTFITVASLLMIGCTEVSKQENKELKQEIETIDSVIVEIDNIEAEIQESSAKLDELLNDL